MKILTLIFERLTFDQVISTHDGAYMAILRTDRDSIWMYFLPASTIGCSMDIPVDLVILMDQSGSIRGQNPQDGSADYWTLMVDFVEDLINKFPGNTGTMRVSIIVYSNTAKLVTNLVDPVTAKYQLRNSRDMEYIGGSTNLPDALLMVKDRVLSGSNLNNRRDAYDVILVLADGLTNTNPAMVNPFANAIKTSGPTGAYLFEVAIGGATTNSKSYFMADGLVTRQEDLIFVDEFENMDENVDAAKNLICRYLEACVTVNGCPGPFGPFPPAPTPPPPGKIMPIEMFY